MPDAATVDSLPPWALLRLAAALVLLAGVGIGARLLILRRALTAEAALVSLPRLRGLGFRPVDAAAALLVALAVGVPAVWPQPAAGAVGQPSGPGAFVLPLLLFGAMLTVALACGHATGRGVRAAFGIERGARAAALRRGALGGLALVPPVLLMALAADGLLRGLGVPVEAQPALKLLADQTCPLPARLTLAALAVLVAPLAEEALFRGTLLPALLARSSTGTSLLLQATFFSAVHGHGASFLPLLVAGLGFGAGYVLTGSVATPVAMHAVFNAATMLLYLAA